jgi:hypothetical protein
MNCRDFFEHSLIVDTDAKEVHLVADTQETAALWLRGLSLVLDRVRAGDQENSDGASPTSHSAASASLSQASEAVGPAVVQVLRPGLSDARHEEDAGGQKSMPSTPTSSASNGRVRVLLYNNGDGENFIALYHAGWGGCFQAAIPQAWSSNRKSPLGLPTPQEAGFLSPAERIARLGSIPKPMNLPSLSKPTSMLLPSLRPPVPSVQTASARPGEGGLPGQASSSSEA